MLSGDLGRLLRAQYMLRAQKPIQEMVSDMLKTKRERQKEIENDLKHGRLPRGWVVTTVSEGVLSKLEGGTTEVTF